MLLDNWLSQRAQTSPDRIALIADGKKMAYAELESAATAAARRLAAKGVRRGSVVTLTLPPGIEYVVLIHAAMKLGAVIRPQDPRMTERERAAAAGAGPGPSSGGEIEIAFAADAEGHEADLPLLGELDLDAPFAQVHTGGSSGAPTRVPLTYGNVLWSAVGSAFNLGVDPADRWLCCLPLFHVAGLSIAVRSAIYGTTCVMHDGFETDRVARSLREDGITVVSLVATALQRLLEAGAEVDRPRAILVGGGPVPTDVLDRALDRGATVVQTYGLTEAASQVTALPPEDAKRKRGSAGRPLLTTHIRIEDGEILVQGPTVAPGFCDVDGWLHTGDLGRIDGEGYLWVEGRTDDMIVTGGENVSPEEIEDLLRRHPDVSDVAVVGRPDPEWQQAVTAVIVPAGGPIDSESLRSHCAEALPPYKVPKRFEPIDELPRTAAGKLMRSALR